MITLANDPFLAKFRNAAAFAAHYEMGLRLLADKTPALEKFSLSQRLQDVEDRVCEHFAAHLSRADTALLGQVRVLRNKLLHAEFSVAQQKLQELGHAREPERVSLITYEGELSAEKLVALVPSAVPHSDADPVQGRLLKWVMQMAIDSSFDNAAKSFGDAIDLLDRLAVIG